MRRFRAKDLVVERKPDLTPVTEVDTAIERDLRRRIAEERPDDAVVGEEMADTGAGSRQWVIDPIDGTKSYARGNETWATLIALEVDGAVQVAVASVPALGQRYEATRGGGARLNGERIEVSAVDDLAAAMLAHTSLSGFVWLGMDDRLSHLAARCWDSRGLGNSMSHLAVARGSADLGWTSRACRWDFAALSLIVEEAGGRFTDRTRDGATIAPGMSSNGLLHDHLLAAADD